MKKPGQQLTKLPGHDVYDVGYGKPPTKTRFRPGQSGNPKGKPKGAKNAKPSLSEERIKSLIMEEAYRTIPIVERGRRTSIPMMTAILRAVAMNAAKGNNRAAILFTTLVSKTEADNSKLASEAFGSAIDYKLIWGKELDRRKKLGLKLPDPVPHPDDIILDARKMAFRIAGPMTRDEIPRYRLGAELLAAYKEANVELAKKADAMPPGPDRDKINRNIHENNGLIVEMTPHFGTRGERLKDPLVREVEEIVGEPLDLNDPDDAAEEV